MKTACETYGIQYSHYRYSRKKSTQIIFKIKKTENILNFGREMNIHKAQWIPNNLNSNRATQSHVIIKLSKVKDQKKKKEEF